MANLKKYSLAKPPTPKAKAKEPAEDDYSEPWQHLNQDIKDNKKKFATNLVGNNQASNQAQFQTKKPWSYKFIRGEEKETDTRLLCDYHQIYGHLTYKCRQLNDKLMAKFSSGEVQINLPPNQ